jgi:hypothetical protein
MLPQDFDRNGPSRRWVRWPEGRALAVLRQLGVDDLVAIMERARHLIVLSWDANRRRLVAAGQAAVWNGHRSRVAVLVPSWKEARRVCGVLVGAFGAGRRVAGSPRWQPLQEVRDCDVLVVTYKRFVNYLEFQARCGFYRVVLHNVDQVVRTGQLPVLETLLERVRRSRLGFQVCCTAGGLPAIWVTWLCQRFPGTIVAGHGGTIAPDANQVRALDCADLGLDEVISCEPETRCLVIPSEGRAAVAARLAETHPGVKVLAYGERVASGQFAWVGIDVRRGWPTPAECRAAWRLKTPNGRLALLYDGSGEDAAQGQVVKSFLAALIGGDEQKASNTEGGIARQQSDLELVLQLLRKVRYVRELPELFQSLFLFAVRRQAFLQTCEAALARLKELKLVSHPSYALASGRVIRAGWLRATPEGQRLASDFAPLQIPRQLEGVESLEELLEVLPELHDWLSLDDLCILSYWAGGEKPPPPKPPANPDRLEALGRLYRSMRFAARVCGLEALPEWEQVRHWPVPPSSHGVPKVPDAQVVRRLAERLCLHVVEAAARSLGLDVDPWRIVDPREVAQLEALEVNQVKRLLFRFFVSLTPPRETTLQRWVDHRWLPRRTVAQVRAVAACLQMGLWRPGVGRPRIVLLRCPGGI